MDEPQDRGEGSAQARGDRQGDDAAKAAPVQLEKPPRAAPPASAPPPVTAAPRSSESPLPAAVSSSPPVAIPPVAVPSPPPPAPPAGASRPQETELGAFAPPVPRATPTRIDDEHTVDEVGAPDPVAAPEPPVDPAPPRVVASRRRLVALAVAVGIPAFLVGVALVAYRPIARRMVLGRARALGIELTFEEMDLHVGRVKLTGARASLAGVNGLAINADAITLTTSGLEIESVDAEGIKVAVDGPATDRLLELATWSGEHQATMRLPASGRGVHLEWRAREGAPAWLTLNGGTLTGDGSSGHLTATAVAFGVPAGTVAATVAVDAAGVTLEAGKRQGPPPLSASLRTAAQPHTLTIKLRPIEVGALAEALGVTLPSHGTTVSGQADLTLGKGGSTGTASLEIDGWIPPHPKSADGIIYGKKTSMKTKLTLSEDHASATFDDLELKAGRLALKGSGSLLGDAGKTMLRLELAGSIPCGELARNRAAKELPGFLGDLFGEVVGRAVGGSASVNVSVEGEAKNLAAVKITPRVSVGCALRVPGL